MERSLINGLYTLWGTEGIITNMYKDELKLYGVWLIFEPNETEEGRLQIDWLNAYYQFQGILKLIL